MSKKNKISALENFKTEAAKELGVDLKQGASLTAKETGSVGGRMVKKIIESCKNQNN